MPRLLKKLGLIAAVALVSVYVLGVLGGFLWLRYGRDFATVEFWDIALLQVSEVRRGFGEMHFEQARRQAADSDYQAAFLSFSSALNNAPDDVDGRLDAADFFARVGANAVAMNVLEEGLDRHPDDARLIEATFDFLLNSRRENQIFALLQERYPDLTGHPHANLLRTFELQATLRVEGTDAANRLIEQHPGLVNFQPAVPVVARVMWASSLRFRAIDLLTGYLPETESGYADFATAVDWQLEGGLVGDAVKTADRARSKFPELAPAWLLVIKANAANQMDGNPRSEDLAAYFREFGADTSAWVRLAALAGDQGWVDLTGSLYAVALNTIPQVGALGLSHADALARKSRFVEYETLLDELDAQSSGASQPYLLELRSRQIIASAALNQVDRVRDFSRRLVAAAAGDSDRLRAFQRYFSEMGITEAVEEFERRLPN